MSRRSSSVVAPQTPAATVCPRAQARQVVPPVHRVVSHVTFNSAAGRGRRQIEDAALVGEPE